MSENESLEAELETLRGIARRIGDGWRANQREHQWRLSPVHAEPMTPAEVSAIWPDEADK